MNARDAVKAVEQSGTKISKDKLIETLKKSSQRDFPFVKEFGSMYALVRIPMGN